MFSQGRKACVFECEKAATCLPYHTVVCIMSAGVQCNRMHALCVGSPLGVLSAKCVCVYVCVTDRCWTSFKRHPSFGNISHA